MKTRINFMESIHQLSEEQIKQICRFTKMAYVEGEWQRWRAYSEFKKWHFNLMKNRDEQERNK
jgi:hypothetical protein